MLPQLLEGSTCRDGTWIAVAIAVVIVTGSTLVAVSQYEQSRGLLDGLIIVVSIWLHVYTRSMMIMLLLIIMYRGLCDVGR